MVKLNVDVSRRIAPQAVCAKQGDTTRQVKLAFFENGQEWAAPTGMSAMVAFGKPDATGGVYDTLPDGSSAITVASDRKSAIITLAPQVTSVAGICTAELRFYNSASGAQFGLFSFLVDVEAASDADLQSANYFYLSVIGDMSALKTSSKSTIVDAINEVIPDLFFCPDFKVWTGIGIEETIDGYEWYPHQNPHVGAIVVGGNGYTAVVTRTGDHTLTKSLGTQIFVPLMSARDVTYNGNIGDYAPKNVSAAFEAVMNTLDEKLDGIAPPADMSADYAASGAQSVKAWATMAKTGDASQYRVAAGQYRVTDAGDVYTVRIVDSTYTSWTVRRIEIVSGDDEANAYVDVYTCNAPGTQIHHVLGVGSDDGAIVIGGKRYPLVTSPETEGNILTAAKNTAGVVVPQWAVKPTYKADEIKATVPYGDETGSAKNVQYALDMLAANLSKVNVPAVTTADNGSFLRVVNGTWAAVQLTDVSEVGA